MSEVTAKVNKDASRVVHIPPWYGFVVFVVLIRPTTTERCAAIVIITFAVIVRAGGEQVQLRKAVPLVQGTRELPRVTAD